MVLLPVFELYKLNYVKWTITKRVKQEWVANVLFQYVGHPFLLMYRQLL